MTERSRHKLFESLIGLVDDEQAVEEMLSYFPARDVEEPVTKDFLRAEMSGLRSELRSELAGLRSELHSEIGTVRAEVRDLRAEMQQMMRTTQTWFVATGISLAGLMIALARFG